MASALPSERKVQSFFKGKAVQEITQGGTFQKGHIFGGLRFSMTGGLGGDWSGWSMLFL